MEGWLDYGGVAGLWRGGWIIEGWLDYRGVAGL